VGALLEMSIHMKFVEYYPTCDVTFCGEHPVLVKHLHSEASFYGDCNSKVTLILKQTNEYVLCKLHELGALCDYPERRYESGPNENITDLFVEQMKMKQQWDQLCILYREKYKSDPKSESVTDLFA